MIISGGENVHPTAIESAVLRCNGIDEAGVVAIDDEEWGESIALLYVGSADPADVAVWCRDHLRGAMRPRIVERAVALPYGQTGKLQRKRLALLLR